ncbi:MAG: HDOD domain-containing protein [Zoogloeaceae bacterium]|nr:HDOD domain-containing protein [Zoogloeaceae bacterium]
MLGRLLKRFFRGGSAPEASAKQASFPPSAPIPQRAPPTASAGASLGSPAPETFLCREAVLGRDERIAGYQFMLREAGHRRLYPRSRRVAHLCSEVLVTTLLRADLGRVLGPRLAFIEVPDSFFDHPSLTALPAHQTVLLPRPHEDAGAPDLDALFAQCRRLQGIGFRIALPDPLAVANYAGFVSHANLIWLEGQGLDAGHDRQLRQLLHTLNTAPPALLVRRLDTLEHFRYCFKSGAHYFQGPFVTCRENWDAGHLSPNVGRVNTLIARLRNDAPTAEIIPLIKQDAALSLRLLRYVNSAAVALPEKMSSIERALMMVGRDKLYRWLILLAYGADAIEGRASAAMEAALVRGRMLELLGRDRLAPERESLFLVGLLSLADVILRAPLDKALAPLGLDPDIEGTLGGRPGPWRDLLELAIACEHANAQGLEDAAARCRITPQAATNCHLDALRWAMELQA